MIRLDDIQAEAQNLGFILLGVSPVQPPAHLAVYQAWVDSGRHAGMAYLADERARQRRADPTLILPEARAVISLALPYPHPDSIPAPEVSGPHGRVAAYAWGQDYHEVIPPRLTALQNRLGQVVGAPLIARAYTDTGPILERDFAMRAGLGWIGKNTCLIHPALGSFHLLAELFVSTELEPTASFTADRCGSCRRCLDACPTGCIRPDRTLEAGRCISYLTIEHKGMIPRELRPALGDWVFGCDICQQVCPWNRHAAANHPADPAFAPRPGVPRPSLVEELSLSPQDFNRKFRASPLQRTRRRGYLRNVSLALGNQPDPAAVPALAGLLKGDAQPQIRAAAAWALHQIATPAARQALDSVRASECDSMVLAEITPAE